MIKKLLSKGGMSDGGTQWPNILTERVEILVIIWGSTCHCQGNDALQIKSYSICAWWSDTYPHKHEHILNAPRNVSCPFMECPSKTQQNSHTRSPSSFKQFHQNVTGCHSIVLQGPGAKGSAKGQGSSESTWHREVLIDLMKSTKVVNRLRCHALHRKFFYILLTVDEVRAQKNWQIWELPKSDLFCHGGCEDIILVWLSTGWWILTVQIFINPSTPPHLPVAPSAADLEWYGSTTPQCVPRNMAGWICRCVGFP